MAHAIWLNNATGGHVELLTDVISFSYTRVVNGLGAWTLALPCDSMEYQLLFNPPRTTPSMPPRDLKTAADWQVAFVRDGVTQMIGLLRKTNYTDDSNGLTTVTLSGYDFNDLLRRRIVAYASGTSQADKTDYADDMMKVIVRENMGASAVAARDLTANGFSVQVDLSLGPSMSKAFAWRNVLTVLQEIADAAKIAGTAVYFDIVPTSDTTCEFQTFANIRGNDHSATSAQPVTIGVEFGSLATPAYEEDRSAEANYVYAGGQGEGASRVIVEVSDSTRIGASVWNRQEVFADARNEDTTDKVTAVARAALKAGEPTKRFSGNVVDTPGCRYGIEWGFGDKLTATYLGAQYTAMIKAVTVGVDSNGNETITARLDAE